MAFSLPMRLWTAAGLAVAAGLVAAVLAERSIELAVGVVLLGLWLAGRQFAVVQSELTALTRGLSQLARPSADSPRTAAAAGRTRPALPSPSFETATRLTEQIALRLGAEESRQSKDLLKLRSSAVVLETAFRSMRDGLVVIAADRSVVLLNPAAQSLLGTADPDSRLEGRGTLEEVVRSSEAQSLVRQALRGKEAGAEFALGRADWVVQALATPLPIMEAASESDTSIVDLGSMQLVAGEIAAGGAMLVMHDVTELRRVEKLRQEFVSNVSHELKTPLTTIRAYTDTLQEEFDGGELDPETATRFLGRIDQQAERLHEMVANLLALARIDGSSEAMQVEPLDPRPLLVETVESQQILARQRELTLTADLPATLPPVRADRTGLRSVVDNLVRNAIQHTPPGGSVRVEARTVATDQDSKEGRSSAEAVEIAVIDTGCGIPREAQTRLFERFYRVDSARTRDRGGSGLGLAIVAGLVSRFGGTVAVQSELGRGSTFRVRLPVAADRDPAAPAIARTS